MVVLRHRRRAEQNVPGAVRGARLNSAYYWTADPAEDTLQVVRFYVPAIGAISLLGAWLVTRVPGRARLAGLTSAAVVTAMFGLGPWSFHAMVASR